MSDEEFSTHKEAVLSKILEKPKKMSSKFDELWFDIYNQVRLQTYFYRSAHPR